MDCNIEEFSKEISQLTLTLHWPVGTPSQGSDGFGECLEIYFEALLFFLSPCTSKIGRVMKLVKPVSVVLMGCLGLSTFATPEILKKFKEVYSKPNANCQTCHVKPPQRNVYGKALEDALDRAKTQEVTVEIFRSIEKDDSDGDGVPNIDEIKGNSLPGDPNSKPAAGQSKSNQSELIPKHTFHPAIVHFPIALLAIAALLEFLSKWKKEERFHSASIINLSVGLICSIGAIATGMFAWLRLGYSLEGNLLLHLIIASGSVLVGVVAYLQREKPTYFWLVIGSGILVLIAGHFGGNMVYG
jgi:uncharacterized membrane protein